MKKHDWIKFCVGFVALLMVVISVHAQQSSNAPAGGTTLIEPEEDAPTSEFVTITVKDANISEVLKAYSLQTGQSIVVGPDVVSDNVNVRLNNIPWEDALDVILKPYGFGYQVIGDTIVINKLENIVTVEGIEPLVSRVFRLAFLDAYDIKEIIEAQLTARGKFTIHETKSLPGWEFGGDSGASGAATEGGIRTRKKKEEIQKSKTFVVTDVPSAITKIESLLEDLDMMPEQVLIEAKFLEISTDGLSDIGLEYINAVEDVVDASTLGAGSLTPALVDDNLLKVLNMTTGYLDPLDAGASGSYSQDNGIRLTHSVLGDWGADMLFAFMAQDDDANVLSAPRVLTLNNQEAAILVGQKYPIIESDSNSGGGGTAITSTSLDYYENIGIQLNVIPQVCSDEYVNMIVHPAVSEISGFEAGVVTAGSSAQSGTQYPVLKIREAETQIMVKSDSTAIIGGLQTERDKEQIKKVPFLGDIPFIGRLFRRETVTKEKIDLLIFIKASIIDEEAYATESEQREKARQARMELEILKDGATEKAADVETVKETAPVAEPEPAEPELTAEENEEMLDLVSSMNGATNAPAASE